MQFLKTIFHILDRQLTSSNKQDKCEYDQKHTINPKEQISFPCIQCRLTKVLELSLSLSLSLRSVISTNIQRLNASLFQNLGALTSIRW